ncbi:hypothetical protein CHUAL_006592 [Chamberlinius hualienensis]
MNRFIYFVIFTLTLYNAQLVKCQNRRYDYGQYYFPQLYNPLGFSPAAYESASINDNNGNGGSGVTPPVQATGNQLLSAQQNVANQTAKSEVESLTSTIPTTTTAEAVTLGPEIVTEAAVAEVTEATTAFTETTTTSTEATTAFTEATTAFIEATTTATEATTTTTEATTQSTTLSNTISGGSVASGGFLAMMGGSTTAAGLKQEAGNFDKYLDTILGNLSKGLRQGGFDPLKIGRMLQCRNCSMDGLSLIRRAGPANLVYANKSLVIDAHLGLPALYISCFPCIDVILSIPFTGMLEVALWNLQIYGKVSQRVQRGANPKLEEYRVVKEGELDIKLNGYGILAPMAEIGFKIIHQRQVSSIIRELVYERIPSFIQDKLKGFSLPIGKR